MTKAILMDIEGNVSPISFVREVLFPYSKEKIEQFVKQNLNNPELKKILEQVKKIEGKDLSTDEIIKILKRWIDEDRKIAPLKDIQGLIWKGGFESGELKAHLYEDAYKKIKEWKQKGYRLYIYSSGSVQAQKLFFSHTNYGDLTGYFDGYFDTKTGNKKEKQSYIKIAQTIGLKPDQIIFLSDNPDEIKAAAQSGMIVYRLVRPNDAEYINDFPHPQVKDFYEVDI